jgi:hypothetical protein
MAVKPSASHTTARLAIVSGLPALAYAGAPWWIISAMLGTSLLLSLVQATFPQESADQLAWWRDRRRQANRRQRIQGRS